MGAASGLCYGTGCRAACGTWALLLVWLAMPLLAAQAPDDPYLPLRERMIQEQIVSRGVRDARVLEAMRAVPRHWFVPPEWAARAYEDRALPIGEGQTISQPYIVALMTELLRPAPNDVVLEIGTGSGYQAAVLSGLVKHVYTIELLPTLATSAAQRLARRGYRNVTVRAGDGYQGWPEFAPFDAIIVTAAPPEIPPALVRQLKRGGRMVLPVGEAGESQTLMVVEKSLTSEQITRRTVLPVRFVPMVRPENPSLN